MKKLIALVLVLAMALTASLALAKTVEPEETDMERLAGKTFHATVGAYSEIDKTFQVTVYEKDRFDDDDIEELKAGDILLVGGRACTVKEMTKTPDGELMAVTEDGSEIVFVKDHGDFAAQSTEDDRQYMHAIAVLHLAAADGIVYEDNSDPDQEKPAVTEGLEGILKAKTEKETNSNGFDFYATTVTVNDQLQIVKIHQDFDVAQ